MRHTFRITQDSGSAVHHYPPLEQVLDLILCRKPSAGCPEGPLWWGDGVRSCGAAGWNGSRNSNEVLPLDASFLLLTLTDQNLPSTGAHFFLVFLAFRSTSFCLIVSCSCPSFFPEKHIYEQMDRWTSCSWGKTSNSPADRKQPGMSTYQLSCLLELKSCCSCVSSLSAQDVAPIRSHWIQFYTKQVNNRWKCIRSRHRCLRSRFIRLNPCVS